MLFYSLVFGTYDLVTDISEGDIRITVEGRGKRKRYYRRMGTEELEKVIFAKGGNLVVCPTEPVNIPREEVSEHLLIELEKPLIVESGLKETFYVKTPVEIGVFLVDMHDIERIDLFTETKPKYTLYGPPESGIICRWWKSNIFEEKPPVEKLFEGVLRVDRRGELRDIH